MSDEWLRDMIREHDNAPKEQLDEAAEALTFHEAASMIGRGGMPAFTADQLHQMYRLS